MTDKLGRGHVGGAHRADTHPLTGDPGWLAALVGATGMRTAGPREGDLGGLRQPRGRPQFHRRYTRWRESNLLVDRT